MQNAQSEIAPFLSPILGRISGLLVQDKRFSDVNMLFLYSSRAVRHENRNLRVIEFAWAPSGKRSRTGLHGQSIEKIFQRLLSCQVCRAMRAEATFPQLDAHRSALAADLPIPAIPIVLGSGNGNVK
jgi:hypothetical protein